MCSGRSLRRWIGILLSCEFPSRQEMLWDERQMSEDGKKRKTHAARKPKVQKRPIVDPRTQSQPANPPSGGIFAVSGWLIGGAEASGFSKTIFLSWDAVSAET